MSRTVSRFAIIWTIVKKDLKMYSRDKLWIFLTILTLVFVIIIFWLLPDKVDESISVGVSGLGDPAIMSVMGDAEAGLGLVPFASKNDLQSVVSGEAKAWRSEGNIIVIPDKSDVKRPSGSKRVNVSIGLAFSKDFFANISSGRREKVEVLVDTVIPEEIRNSMSSLIRELAYTVAGQQLPVTTAQIDEVYTVLGEDRAGNQVTPRENFRPMFVFLILLMEMFGMSSLIARELQSRTAIAVLVTPATTGDLLTAKAISGVVLGLGQALILLAALNVLGTKPLLLITLMFIGTLMVSGTAMLAGTLGRDFISNLFAGMAFMIPLMIPAFGTLFPGTASTWLKILPSYPLVRGLVDVSVYGDGWSDVIGELGALLAWCVGLFALGWFVLKRKVETL